MTNFPKCYGWIGTDGTGHKAFFLGCAVNPGWTAKPIVNPYMYPSDNGENITGNPSYGAIPISLTLLNNQSDIDAWKTTNSYAGNCYACPIFTPKPDDCPPGTCKCASSVYPGYCCLDCDSISSKINQIISQVKQLN